MQLSKDQCEYWESYQKAIGQDATAHWSYFGRECE